MRFYGIDFVAQELGVHPSSLRRWEENALISPERATMGRTALRIYDEETMRVLRRAKALIDERMSASDPVGHSNYEMEYRDDGAPGSISLSSS